LIIAEGTPEQVVENKKSYTGQYLKPLLKWCSVRRMDTALQGI
jgi:excinuclease ABC subunit A